MNALFYSILLDIQPYANIFNNISNINNTVNTILKLSINEELFRNGKSIPNNIKFSIIIKPIIHS